MTHFAVATITCPARHILELVFLILELELELELEPVLDFQMS